MPAHSFIATFLLAAESVNSARYVLAVLTKAESVFTLLQLLGVLKSVVLSFMRYPNIIVTVSLNTALYVSSHLSRLLHLFLYLTTHPLFLHGHSLPLDIRSKSFLDHPGRLR